MTALTRLLDWLERRARLDDRSLAFKVAAAPALMLAMFLLLALLSGSALLMTERSVDRIVSHDMRDVARLNAIATQFGEAESALYRLLVAKAAATSATDVPGRTARIKAQLADVRGELAAFRRTADPRDRPALGEAIAGVERYAGAVDVVTSMLEVDFGSSAAMLAPFRDNARQVESRIKRLAADGSARADSRAASTVFITRLFLSVLLVGMLLSAILGLVLAFAVGRATVRSITGIATATSAVMGDDEIDLAPLRRRDELGSVVAALEAFQAERRETRRLESTAARLRQEAQEAEARRHAAIDEVRRQAERDRHATLESLAQSFDDRLARLIAGAQDAMGDLDRHASALDDTATGNRRLAAELDGIASLFASEMEEASGAARSLARTFSDIDGEVAGTSEAAHAITEHARTARDAVARSRDQAATIEHIVDVIAEVAQQTNLLALNATIEAARAGQAGSGFAVVATEIKSLASRTASSTTEVRHQVDAVQRHIAKVVTSTDGLSGLIAGLDEMSRRVAAMSRGQASSTDQLDERIKRAHERSHTLAAASSSIGESAQHNLVAVQQLRRTGRTLDEMLAALARDAQAFTRHIRER